MAGCGTLAGPCRPRAPKVGYPAAGRLHVPRAGASQASRLRPRSSQALPTQFAPSGVSQRSQRSRCAAAVGLARLGTAPGFPCPATLAHLSNPRFPFPAGASSGQPCSPVRPWRKEPQTRPARSRCGSGWGAGGRRSTATFGSRMPALHPQLAAARHRNPACQQRQQGQGPQLPCMPLWLLLLSFRGRGCCSQLSAASGASSVDCCVQLEAARQAAQASLATEPPVEWVDRFSGQARKGCDILVQVCSGVEGFMLWSCVCL